MKNKNLIYLFLAVITILFTTCEKDPEIPIAKITLTSEKIEPTAITAFVKAEYSCPNNTIRAINMYYSLDSTMSNEKCIVATMSETTKAFSLRLVELTALTKYYYCYEFSNSISKFRTEVKTFSTRDYMLPVVTTRSVSGIRGNEATCGGNISDDGGLTVTARGVCWSTTQNPTVSGSYTTDGSGMGTFTSSMIGLTISTTYYVRAYATNEQGTSYGEEKSFTTWSSLSIAIAGLFSVSATQQVYFSRGNLQYQASTNTWRFAEHQYDMVGIGNATDLGNNNYVAGNVVSSDNRQISSSYAGWIDLFGWGTSGYNGKSPWMTSINYYDYGNGTRDIAGTNYDWGVYNKISNGGNQAGLWRTLTKDEWVYLFKTRTNATKKYGVACVNDINGLVLLPDNWTLPAGLTFTSGVASNNGSEYYKTINNYTATQWTQMETAGAVFLPAAGSRYGTGVNYVGDYGFYWSVWNGAYYVSFNSLSAHPSDSNYSYYGLSVRLVQDF